MIPSMVFMVSEVPGYLSSVPWCRLIPGDLGIVPGYLGSVPGYLVGVPRLCSSSVGCGG